MAAIEDDTDNDMGFDPTRVHDGYPETTDYEAISARDLGVQARKQMEEFSDLLCSLDKSLDKKKRLWKQIFENAVTDRKNAYIIFIDLYLQVQGKPQEHAIHGTTLSKYMERMSKATDQLIKLAELVAAAEERTPVSSEGSEMSEDDLYTSIKKTREKH